MARQTAKVTKPDSHAVPCHANLQKDARLQPLQDLLRHGRNGKSALPALNQRPMQGQRQTTAADMPHRRQTVSVAGIFKKKPKKSSCKKCRSHKDAPAESDLLAAFKRTVLALIPNTLTPTNISSEGLHEARSTLIDASANTFNAVYRDFATRLTTSRPSNEAFLEKLSSDAAILGASLTQERIRTIFSRDNGHVTEVIEIGKRILQFRASVEKDEARLKESWRLWEELQNEYIELGAEVLGEENLEKGERVVDDRRREQGFRKEMSLMELDRDSRVREIKEEIWETVEKAVGKVKATEKELDAVTKREQERLLHALIHE